MTSTGKLASGLVIVFANCNDPAKEQEFGAWYDTVHIPAMLGTGAFTGATRWVTGWEYYRPSHVQTRFATLYETALDPAEAMAVMRREVPKLPENQRGHPNLAYRTAILASRIFTTASAGLSGQPKSKGMLFVGMNNTVPAMEEEFNQWYNKVHGDDYMDIPGITAYHRWRIVNPQAGDPQYLGLAEIDSHEVERVVGRIQTISGKHKPPAENMVDRVFRLRCTRAY